MGKTLSVFQFPEGKIIPGRGHVPPFFCLATYFPDCSCGADKPRLTGKRKKRTVYVARCAEYGAREKRKANG